MTLPRAWIVDLETTPWYHCISSCVRQEMLLNRNGFDRKAFIEERLEFLSRVFAISIGSHAIMENHIHLVLYIDKETAVAWDEEEVVRRWFILHPIKNKKQEVVEPDEKMIKKLAADSEFVEKQRKKLMDLGHFHKCLKEPLSRAINSADGTRGTIFAERFKSKGILDLPALLQVLAYVDLNPVAAGIVKLPEESPYTSFRLRVKTLLIQTKLGDLEKAMTTLLIDPQLTAGVETEGWLMPIEDRRLYKDFQGGMIEGFTLGHYLMLVDMLGRRKRSGKASIPSNAKSIFERLKLSVDSWITQQEKLGTRRPYGHYYSTDSCHLSDVAKLKGRKHLVNAGGSLSA